ncbi:D-glycero-beta-D-manno-heptose-7-phosphate kinase [Paramagnetospirillum magneticum]|uniref:Bifunctional protein HldE n=1 Tax=Paramagnetospirillum magneticum (strain ATCC 700264 / AMB-1) TaxID=342108 RepID=HLDE_PARM1|nr:D-glycero-beta-D-manno-heptose-7-phosphate kinase [Paramagnetospirillum magneticum]Q2W993.1 RecName: Full=Bifunctional protein HldE; Includes: RecName: Full=D-beta-D-heptose 7-phosphate kinase; AltName: Full=D-beta-D-heptose 7-phosphotransferase; AltName: Full=D-glycero-beta-D-manno-heptose-7-phosphate kinase; Includes: RecName: Full=D-beta-D-heptose 1-phosphate adenylyltransferase; AltName: Full=D-glycero-beta-D-manno-heptose 1-phosphate adenylyltransferase [Paramagnetospirillum magneticum AMB
MTELSALVERVEKLRGTMVLCVGDAMLDRFVYGSVERISPEAPIPVLCIERETAMLGGAGNVVRNLVAVGAEPAFVSVVGDDTAGREVTRLVGEHGEIDPCIVVEPGRQTTIKTRFFASHQQLLRADRESRSPVGEAIRAQLLTRIERLLPKAGVMVLSDYGKGVLAEPIAIELIRRAKAAGKQVIVDPKGTDYTIYAGATVVTPNRKELHEATGQAVDSDEQVVAAARQLIDSCGFEAVLVTRSQDGMTLVRADGQIDHLPAEAREVFDVSGAGDTVVATLAAALASGATLPEAAHLANVAAGIVVGKVGTAVAYGDELVVALHREDLTLGEAKIVPVTAAAEVVDRWRRKGQKVGFTNGCFDLLHPGHVSILAQAKGACDKLVVGLNSDASVQRLKGPTRPVQSEASRATVLSSLATVDLVVIFGEDTPLEVIGTLKPDVLVKGADYTIDKVVGADLVQSWGGKVVLAELVNGQSTTNTIKKMNGN